MATADTHAPSAYFDLWSAAIAAVLTQMAGLEWRVDQHAEPSVGPTSADIVRVDFSASQGLTGRTSLVIPKEHARRLLTIFTGEAPDAEWILDDDEALQELFRQFAGRVATELKAEFGEVVLQIAASDVRSDPGMSNESRLRCAGDELQVRIDIDAELQRGLSRAVPEPQAKPVSTPQNLDLLRNVELAVTLRFGQREMLLREILELQNGAVIELDREVHEPVDLLLNGEIVARGSVVVVDGNYGLRVSEVGPGRMSLQQ